MGKRNDVVPAVETKACWGSEFGFKCPVAEHADGSVQRGHEGEEHVVDAALIDISSNIDIARRKLFAHFED